MIHRSTSGEREITQEGAGRRALEQLRIVASRRETIGYQALGQALGIDVDSVTGRRELADILRDVSTSEVAAGRPMLSAVVVFRSRGTPGQGFFALAEALGRFDGSDAARFLDEELRRVYAYWVRGPNQTEP